jgi:hypothetical protein
MIKLKNKTGLKILFHSNSPATIYNVYNENGSFPVTFTDVAKVLFYEAWPTTNIYKFEVTLFNGTKSIHVFFISELERACSDYAHTIVE